jgi:hypothetical protein
MYLLSRHDKFVLFLIPLISLVLHWHVFKLDLVGFHVWRQTQTQTVINNFYSDDFNIFHPKINDKADTDRIMRMEFPIMQWLFAIFFKLFGNHLIISRILTFIIGLFSVLGMYSLARNIFKNSTIAIIAAWTFNFSPVFYYYTLNPLPDNFALCFAIWSMAFLFKYHNQKRIFYVVLSACFLCIATLAKLPFILYGIVPFVLLIFDLKKGNIHIKIWLISLIYIITILPALAWYIAVIPGWNGNIIIKGVLNSNDNANTLLHILWGNFVSTLPELLINYGSVLFFIAGFYFLFKNRIYKTHYFPVFLSWGITIILYFLYEINAIGTVHDYYLFPFLPLIFMLVTYGAYNLLQYGTKWLRYLSAFALCILPLTAFLRADSRWNTDEPLFNPVYYKHKAELRRLTPPGALCVVGNDVSHYILLYYIDRKGWTFDNDDLKPGKLQYYISKGASYLFTDSPVDSDSAIKKHLSQKVYEEQTLRVYKLN